MNIQEWLEAGKPWNVILHGDCMELMEHIEDKSIELACVDPPYGIGISDNPVRQQHDKKEWDKSIPTKKYFDELKRTSQKQIIWGGNYFLDFLGKTQNIIVWDKKQPENFSLAMVELAWCSIQSPAKMFRYSVLTERGKIHPTQKPVALYRWLLQNYAKTGDKILDTHSGSGSLACACHLEGFDFLAIEKDEDYHRDSVKRFEELKSQGRLFT